MGHLADVFCRGESKVRGIVLETKLKIVDVNRFNPSVDWTKVAEQVDGVIIRVGYRGMTGGLASDPNYKKFLHEAAEAGIKRIGVYWWSAHRDVSEAEVDASYLMTYVQQFRDKWPINFNVWLRSQPFPDQCAFNSLSPEERTECARAFLHVIETQGLKGGIYGTEEWLNEQLVLSELSEYPLWVACHGDTPPQTIQQYVGWQYTGSGKLDGVTRGVGLSWFSDDLAEQN